MMERRRDVVDAGEIAEAERNVGRAHAARRAVDAFKSRPLGQFKKPATWGRPPRLWSDLLLSGFAGVSLGAGRTQRARGSRRTCRPGRSAKAAVFYHHFSVILPGGNFDDASRGELRSNPTKPSG